VPPVFDGDRSLYSGAEFRIPRPAASGPMRRRYAPITDPDLLATLSPPCATNRDGRRRLARHQFRTGRRLGRHIFPTSDAGLARQRTHPAADSTSVRAPSGVRPDEDVLRAMVAAEEERARPQPGGKIGVDHYYNQPTAARAGPTLRARSASAGRPVTATAAANLVTGDMCWPPR